MAEYRNEEICLKEALLNDIIIVIPDIPNNLNEDRYVVQRARGRSIDLPKEGNYILNTLYMGNIITKKDFIKYHWE